MSAAGKLPIRPTRRNLILAGGAAAALAGCVHRGVNLVTHNEGNYEAAVVPGEELMSQHGVLNRTLFIYDTLVDRLRDRDEIDSEILAAAAAVIQQFIEDHHEKLEGHHVFPRFQLDPKMGPFVRTLARQHRAGRAATTRLLALSAEGRLRISESRAEALRLLSRFTRMYRAHESREDTVLFPEFRKLFTPEAYAALGEDFAREMRQKFGADGFAQFVDRVANLERRLGIDDLDQFTV